MAMTVSVQAER